MNSKFEKLETLQKLKNSNVITEKEFEIEKYKILNEVETKQTKKTEGIYVVSLVLGIFSFLFGAVPILGLILSIVALVISIRSRKKLKTNKDKDGKVTAGFILSILGLLIAVLMTIIPLGILIFNFSSSIESIEQANIETPNIELNNKNDKNKTNIYDGYLETIKEHEDSLKNETDFFIEYGLSDIDNNNVEELIIKSGTCTADTEYTFYTYKNNQVIKLGSIWGPSTFLYEMNDGNYLKAITQRMGSGIIQNIMYENGKFEVKEISSKELSVEEEATYMDREKGDVEIIMLDSRYLSGLEILKY